METNTTHGVNLIFEEPPARKYGRHDVESPVGLWLKELRQYPGTWAKYPTPLSNGVTSAIKSGGYGANAGEFESVGRQCDVKGRQWVFAKYVGA